MIKVHSDTFGVTQRALKALRDELADRIDHKVEVWELPAQERGDVGGYGLAIMDYTRGELVIIGDGFRTDGGGEGGAGHRAARALLSIYGISPFHYAEKVEFRPDNDWAWMMAFLRRWPEIEAKEAVSHLPACRDRQPHYIEHVMRR